MKIEARRRAGRRVRLPVACDRRDRSDTPNRDCRGRRLARKWFVDLKLKIDVQCAIVVSNPRDCRRKQMQESPVMRMKLERAEKRIANPVLRLPKCFSSQS